MALSALWQVEVGEKKDRVTDALNATKAAVEEGIVPGTFPPSLYRKQLCWPLGYVYLRLWAFICWHVMPQYTSCIVK